MKCKNQILRIAACLIFTTVQLVSCKKDDANITNRLNQSNVTDVIADSSTDSSLMKGLVAWYTFNGDVLDHSGNHNDVIFNSALPTKGKSGAAKTAYKFDGVGSYMQVANSQSINPLKISLYALVKPTGFYQGTCHGNYILCKETTDYDQGRYLLGFSDQLYYNYNGCGEAVATKYENFFGAFGDGGSTAASAIDSNNYIRLNNWYSLVYTFDGITSKLYVNGILRYSAVQQGTIFSATTTPLYIGKTPNDQFPYFFKGLIDEVRIYKRTLSAKEVKALYTNN